MSVYVVCGEPGSGKTTWCQRHLPERAAVWDMDAVARQLGYRATFPRPDEQHRHLLAMRRRFIDRAKAGRLGGDVAVIVANKEHAEAIARELGAEVVDMGAKQWA